MAATGTPTPNLGLRIPQGTDPASVDDINYNSNLLDTKIGAIGNDSVKTQIDALNSNLSSVRNYTSLGNIASESALGTSLTSQLSGMPSNSAKLFKFIATANDGFIENGNIYFVTLQKNDDGHFASAMINRLGSVVVIGSKGSSGWSFDQLARLTKKIYTVPVTATAAAPLGYYGSLSIQTDRTTYGEPISIWGMDKNGYATPAAYGNNNYIGVCARVEGNCSVTVIFSKHPTII